MIHAQRDGELGGRTWSAKLIKENYLTEDIRLARCPDYPPYNDTQSVHTFGINRDSLTGVNNDTASIGFGTGNEKYINTNKIANAGEFMLKKTQTPLIFHFMVIWALFMASTT